MFESEKNKDDYLSIEEFKYALENNPGIIIIKFSAPWCKSCQIIRPQVNAWIEKLVMLSEKISIYDCDIDESHHLYTYMKTNNILEEIPAMVMYKRDNTSDFMDDIVSSIDTKEIDAFFQRCKDELSNLECGHVRHVK